jgi:hypothetical protein
MMNGSLQSVTNATAQILAVMRAAEKSCFAFSFFSFSAANGAGDAMV